MTLPFDQAAEKYFTPPQEKSKWKCQACGGAIDHDPRGTAALCIKCGGPSPLAKKKTVEAKDTVMMLKCHCQFYSTDCYCFCDDCNRVKSINLAKMHQAEISFKAGEDQAKKEFELKFNPDYLDFQKGVEAGKVLGRQAGIKEIVEWIEPLWQIKLKELGVE
jgi:hypothetical protein